MTPEFKFWRGRPLRSDSDRINEEKQAIFGLHIKGDF